MVRVKIGKKSDSIIKLNIEGHAGFADKGRDLVCASISSIAIGLLNSIDILDNQSCNIIFEDNYINVEVVNNDEIIQTILQVGVIQLQTIEEVYPKNLKIEFTEV
ncbi:MAG: ribosomal-processing cysteine protease Prp [Erysipelotrichaceae bacterium]